MSAGGAGRVHDGVEAALAAVGEAQPRLNAFSVVLADEARARADELDRSPAAGPLHGVPVAVKDLFDVAGTLTTGSCAARFDLPPATRDSAVVAALRAAGAVIVGKTNQHELGAGATGLVSAHGPAVNPWDEAVLPGGSSSGSAVAVAAGLVPVAIGSDTGGSVRMPASFCGITGIKPTWGRIDLTGAMSMNPWFDVAGPMARSAVECDAVFRVLASGAGRPVTPLPGLRMGLPAAFFQVVHRETRRAVDAAAQQFEELGAVVVELDERAGPILDDEWLGFVHTWAEMAAAYPELVDDGRVSPDVIALLRSGHHMSGVRYARSRARAFEIRRSFAGALATVDVLLAPATPYPAPPIAAATVDVDGGAVDVHEGGPSRHTEPVNAAGNPAIAFPVGLSAGGLPIGAQLIGRHDEDETLLAAVATFQTATDHHTRTPHVD